MRWMISAYQFGYVFTTTDHGIVNGKHSGGLGQLVRGPHSGGYRYFVTFTDDLSRYGYI